MTPREDEPAPPWEQSLNRYQMRRFGAPRESILVKEQQQIRLVIDMEDTVYIRREDQIRGLRARE